MWIRTCAEVREIEQAAVARGASLESLMESAGAAVFARCLQKSPKGNWAILAGRGNNGGDALVVARLSIEAGLPVQVWIAADQPSDLGELCALQLKKLQKAGKKVCFVTETASLDLSAFDLIVDGIFGTGLSGPPSGAALTLIRSANASGRPIVAIDVPSGLQADSGTALGVAICSEETVCLVAPKQGLFRGPGRHLVGRVTHETIGIPTELLDQPTDERLIDAEWVAARLPRLARSAEKRANGVVGVVAGSEAMPGAASLCTRGAMRAGAGLVIAASEGRALDAIVASLPEAILADRLVPKWGPVLASCDALIVGPGLAVRGVHWKPIWESVSGSKKPTCLDADALNRVALGDPVPKNAVCMTPHARELSRLLNVPVEEVEADRFASVRAAAKKFGCAVLLKGLFTVISDPDGTLLVNPTGSPTLATAGSGDVLGGMVAALLAKGCDAPDALGIAAYWHGLAGESLVGPGALASEIADALPAVRNLMVPI